MDDRNSAPSSAKWSQLRERIVDLVASGKVNVVEALMSEDPALARDEQMLIDCIYGEFCAREERGQKPAAAEYLQRFPGQQTALRALFEIHAEINQPGIEGSAIADRSDRIESQSALDSLEKSVPPLEESRVLAGDTLKSSPPAKSSPQTAEEQELVRKKLPSSDRAENGSQGNVKQLVLGNYVLIEKIGAGGMGEVFKARHQRMDRLVAVKLLSTAMTQDAAAIARFEREIKAVAKISHPNIVSALDADCANGIHFLVMELVDGVDLSVLVKKNGPLPVENALNCVLQAAKGLEAAHRKGIVHRDIKPSNLLLDNEGTVKILDLGLARLNGDAEATPLTELTNTGTIMGTVDFMSPEQAKNSKNADHRSDIYSLGISFYYLLTGRAAYDGDTMMERLLAHREQPIPSLSDCRPDISENLQSIFQKMVAKDPKDRYQAMTDVVADLAQLSHDGTAKTDFSKTAGPRSDSSTTQIASKQPSTDQTVLQSTGTVLQTVKIVNKPNEVIVGVISGICGIAAVAAIIITMSRYHETKPAASDPVSPEVSVTPVESPASPSEHSQSHKTVKLAFETPEFEEWLRKVKLLSAEQQIEAVSKKLVELNPGFDGKLTAWDVSRPPIILNGKVVGVRFFTDQVTDISPVRAFVDLDDLACTGRPGVKGKFADLSPLQGMSITRLQCANSSVSDLSPLTGLPLRVLGLEKTNVADLAPIAGLPLETLDVNSTYVADLSPVQRSAIKTLRMVQTFVTDLSPLIGMPLQTLAIEHCNITDLTPLNDAPLRAIFLHFRPGMNSDFFRSIQSLELINNTPAETFCKEVDLYNERSNRKLAFQLPDFEQWLKEVASLPTAAQLTAVAEKLRELNATFDGKMNATIENSVVTELRLPTDDIVDISPVLALSRLKFLDCSFARYRAGEPRGLSDLAPLQGIPLTKLAFNNTHVMDLSPLKGMLMTRLEFVGANVADLSPLTGMPLAKLMMSGNPVSDLSPLKGMPLKEIDLSNTFVGTLLPLKGMPIMALGFATTLVKDLAPIEGMPLKYIWLDFKPERDSRLLRSIETLEVINEKPAAEFWKEVEENASPVAK